MSHTDYIAKVPQGFAITAHSANCPVAAMANDEKSFMQCSSILKCSIRKRVTKCCIIFYLMFVNVPVTGKCPLL